MKKIPFIAVWFILIACFFALNQNNADRFEKLTADYDNKVAINLDKHAEMKRLSHILEINNYVSNKQDADFVARFIVDKIAHDTIPEAILDLKTRKFQVPVAYVEANGTDTYKQKLVDVRAQTGWNDEVENLYSTEIPSVVNIQHGGTESDFMTVTVKDPKDPASMSVLDKILNRRHNLSEGVIVRLQKYVRINNEVQAVPMAYARTGKDGVAVFKGLCADSSYSVLPIRDGYSYGGEKGTYLGNWGEQVKAEKTEYSFVSSPLMVRLFQNQKLINMRDDGIVTVRTPESFNNNITYYMITFLTLWMVIFVIGNTGKRRMDNLLASAIMLVSGLSMLLMFGINDPLSEKVLGYDMAKGSIIGAVIIFLLMFIDIKKFFQNGYWVKFDIFMWFVKGFTKVIGWLVWIVDFLGVGRLFNMIFSKLGQYKVFRWIGIAGQWTGKACCATGRWMCSFNGIGYLLGAILLSVMLQLFGQEVGGMKVNLNVGFVFQPSEIIKYMFVVFMAAFFFEKGDSIIAYSEPAEDDGTHILRNLGRKIWTMAGMLAGIAILMAFYVKNGDMGPALVVALTFIVLYSLMKSKVVFNTDSGQSRLYQFLHSDLCMLIAGVLTYIAALFLGNKLSGEAGMWMCSFMWLVGWIVYGWMAGKRFYETPIMFNVLILFFVLGGGFFKAIGFDSISERLMERNSMCVNTWGDLAGEPGINTQVAEGLWGIASGGFTGQGLGNAQAHYIPAFHTDMILQSIGEIMGFFGVIGVILLLSYLLRRTILTGYRTGHPFLLYLCSGIAVISGIQLFIIAFGSLGIIPLTGISVPFFSYGRVSLILNCAAFGIVLAVSARNRATQAVNMKPYNLTVGLLTLAYMSLTALVMAVLAHYQIGPERDKTILREVYVYDTNGAAVVKYNPRIRYISSKMRAGNIYDRNGLLLATSSSDSLLAEIKGDKAEIYKSLQLGDMNALASKVQKRYYPFGEHLFFMVGDMNNQYYFSSIDHEPYGYLAEAQHLSELRGYENRKKLPNGDFDKRMLKASNIKTHKFLPADSLLERKVQLYDYSNILEFVKQGNNSELLTNYNKGEKTGIISNLDQTKDNNDTLVMPHDIYLTVDAALQKKLQDMIPQYLGNPENFRYTNKPHKRYERYSIVVMDAVKGDLLASANYPLPDYERIDEAKGNYVDNMQPDDWTAFTERDLGLTFYTNPGSTAKIMSSLAGFIHMDKIGRQVSREGDYRYHIYKPELIHNVSHPEPHTQDGKGKLGLFRAIDESSNCYFINLVNDQDLYDELSQVYGRIGVRISVNTATGFEFKYPFMLQSDEEIPEDYVKAITAPAKNATAVYRRYIKARDSKEIEPLRMIGDTDIYTTEEWMWAWGEGTMETTPVGMARAVAAAATGSVPRLRFRYDSVEVHRDKLVENLDNLKLLQDAMNKDPKARFKNENIYGKTGTPERVHKDKLLRDLNYRDSIAKKKRVDINKVPFTRNVKDGWYVAYIDKATIPGLKTKESGIIAVAVRVERTLESGSSYARHVFQNVVIPVLKDMHYID